MKRHNDHGNFHERKHLIRACLQFQCFSWFPLWKELWRYMGKHSAGIVAISWSIVSRTGFGFWNIKITLVTHFLQLDHTYSNKATLLGPSQVVVPPPMLSILIQTNIEDKWLLTKGTKIADSSKFLSLCHSPNYQSISDCYLNTMDSFLFIEKKTTQEVVCSSLTFCLNLTYVSILFSSEYSISPGHNHYLLFLIPTNGIQNCCCF